MSGGIAYVLDREGDFAARCNMELVGFDAIGEADAIELFELIEEHHLRTLSPVAACILEDWEASLPRFVKVMPHDYKSALADMGQAEHAMRADAEVASVANAVGVPHTGTSRQS
jgi:glutamate synthase domain-containing protein 3